MHATAFPAVGSPELPVVDRAAPRTAAESAACPVVDSDACLFQRVDKNGARYASCPGADRFGEAFGCRDCFAPELARLRRIEEDGLVTVGLECLTVRMKGRLPGRQVCRVSDRTLGARSEGARHARTV